MRGADEVGPAVMAALPTPIKGSPRERSDCGVVWQLVWWLVQTVLKVYQLDQGTVVSTQRKALISPSSAPSWAEAGSQMELSWGHDGGRVLGCRLCPAPRPVSDGSGENA